MTYSKTKTSFYRRLYIAHLIESGVATIPAITAHSGMPRRTAQDTVAALAEIDIHCEFVGANKSGHYQITDWGPINQRWLRNHLEMLKAALGY